ncbi:DHH family phosphoesterase [Alteromonas macleodii]|uniref:DHH family phosphoesterase n=1 Tax=Alteromonas macleodii TaxID=28108 RepID=UPI003140A029|tara:strand:- start:8340 stop:9155 length:816 start_codon:yes stop_codon:yes gene_type:complete
MENICIYHGSCPDGFGAALAVKLYFDELNQECEFHAAHHGDTTPDVSGKNVIMVDFAYKRAAMIEIKKQAKELIVLDHHETAEKALHDIDGCIFDMTRSGAVMAWEHFHPNKTIPMLFLYIQDKDLYQWKLPYSRAFSAGLRLLDFDFELWGSLIDDNALPPLIEKGRIIEEYNSALVKSATKPNKYRLIELAGHTVPILNATNLISDIGNTLATEYPFAVCYFDTPTERKYSLRSLKEKSINVALIAESLGGGGHPEAAGFEIPLNEPQL